MSTILDDTDNVFWDSVGSAADIPSIRNKFGLMTSFVDDERDVAALHALFESAVGLAYAYGWQGHSLYRYERNKNRGE